MKRRVLLSALAATAVTLGAYAAVTMASPPVGVTPTLLARGTYGEFKVMADQQGPIDLKIQAKTPLDVVVRRHDYAPGSSTGWHRHPGPVLITVTQGTLTFYEYDDPDCTPHRVSAGQGYVDSGHGHIGRNETGEPAQDFSVITAPVGGAFRSELDAPSPHCDF